MAEWRHGPRTLIRVSRSCQTEFHGRWPELNPQLSHPSMGVFGANEGLDHYLASGLPGGVPPDKHLSPSLAAACVLPQPCSRGVPTRMESIDLEPAANGQRATSGVPVGSMRTQILPRAMTSSAYMDTFSLCVFFLLAPPVCNWAGLGVCQIFARRRHKWYGGPSVAQKSPASLSFASGFGEGRVHQKGGAKGVTDWMDASVADVSPRTAWRNPPFPRL